MNDRETLFNSDSPMDTDIELTDDVDLIDDDLTDADYLDNLTSSFSDDNSAGKKHKKKNNKRKSPVNKILAAFTALLLVFNILMVSKYGVKSLFIKGEKAYSPKEISELENKAQEEVLDNLADHLSDGNGILSFLRKTYTSKIVYTDKGKYVFSDIDTSLAPNSFKSGSYDKDSNSEITYSENGQVISHKGIDVSKYQGDIDFSKVRASGVEFAMLRCGYRSYGSGILTEDSSFKNNAENALTNNVDIGIYFFSQAVNKEEAIEEAKFVLDMIRPYKITYPVAIDIEDVEDDYRQQNLSKQELTDVIITFCEEIRKEGYTPMIYSNIRCFDSKVELNRLEDYEKWFAGYDTSPYFPYALSMWQYTDSGKIDGIEGNVDLNISYKTWK